jgi:hypothetical protein
VPFAKRKSGRGPLQRLSDQRRSLALAGLAVGAVCAAIFRRKRRGGEAEFEPFAPPSTRPEDPVAAAQPESEAPAAAVQPEPPVAPVDSGPPPMVEVPPAAEEPELVDEPRPINAAPAGESAVAAETATATSASPLEPATGELSTEEASILAVLAQSGRADDDRTAIAVATSLERDTGDVTGVLRKLGAEGVVSDELRTPSGEEVWAVTERGVRRLGAQS